MNVAIRPIQLLVLALVSLGAAGCNPTVAEDEGFIKLTKRVDALAEDVNAKTYLLSKHDKDIKDFQLVSRDVAQMVAKGGAAGSADAAKALEGRIQSLEAKINELNQRLAALRGVAPSGGAEAAVEEGGAAPLGAKGKPALTIKSGARKRARKGASVDASLNPGAATEAGTDGAPAASVGRGTYYEVRSGDTLRKIAAHYGVTVRAILEANRLPSGAKIAPGASLYIPK